MATVTVKDTIHGRLKRLALEAGTTIGQLVHDGCEHVLELGEAGVASLKKKTRAERAKVTTKSKVQ